MFWTPCTATAPAAPSTCRIALTRRISSACRCKVMVSQIPKVGQSTFPSIDTDVDRIDVSEAQVHAFLRIFVFVPALCAAFASTILALCSVSVRSTFMDEDDLGARVDPAATPYMLDSITDALREEMGLQQKPAAREAASGAVIPMDRRPAASAGAGA